MEILETALELFGFVVLFMALSMGIAAVSFLVAKGVELIRTRLKQEKPLKEVPSLDDPPTLPEQLIATTAPGPEVEPKTFTNSDERIVYMIEETTKILNGVRPNIKEIVLFYGNLGYLLGASVGGYKEHGPTLEELKKMYFTRPTTDVSLMLQGLTVCSWEEDLREETLTYEKKRSTLNKAPQQSTITTVADEGESNDNRPTTITNLQGDGR